MDRRYSTSTESDPVMIKMRRSGQSPGGVWREGGLGDPQGSFFLGLAGHGNEGDPDEVLDLGLAPLSS